MTWHWTKRKLIKRRSSESFCVLFCLIFTLAGNSHVALQRRLFMLTFFADDKFFRWSKQMNKKNLKKKFPPIKRITWERRRSARCCVLICMFFSFLSRKSHTRRNSCWMASSAIIIESDLKAAKWHHQDWVCLSLSLSLLIFTGFYFCDWFFLLRL